MVVRWNDGILRIRSSHLERLNIDVAGAPVDAPDHDIAAKKSAAIFRPPFRISTRSLMRVQPVANTSLITLPQAWQNGDGAAFASLFDQVYDQLKKIAAHRLRASTGRTN